MSTYLQWWKMFGFILSGKWFIFVCLFVHPYFGNPDWGAWRYPHWALICASVSLELKREIHTGAQVFYNVVIVACVRATMRWAPRAWSEQQQQKWSWPQRVQVYYDGKENITQWLPFRWSWRRQSQGDLNKNNNSSSNKVTWNPWKGWKGVWQISNFSTVFAFVECFRKVNIERNITK